MTQAATEHSRQFQQRFQTRLPQSDTGWEDATEGLVAAYPQPRITDADGHVVRDLVAYDFLESDAPPTANPSLWRMARLNSVHGLFRIADRIYQVRGLDISNMTVIVGDTGYIVVDPLMSVETARAGFDLVRVHLGDRPVTGILYTHCHIDHFGGVEGVVTSAEVEQRGIPVIAPEAFVQHAINENMYSGAAEARRNEYMFGPLLAPGPKGHITSGIGVAASTGRNTLIAPTIEVPRVGLSMTIDGIDLVFEDASGGEAPSEFHFYLPQFSVVCLAENVTQVMHNLYTQRGAPVRDGLLWAQMIDDALERYGDLAEVAIMSHHWPVRGRERIREYLEKQRDLYKFIHDETLRLANHGFTGAEIAELIALPESLEQFWPNRGVYGSLKVNARAVYQRYLGWFDGNPAHLDPLPPHAAGGKYVEAMGGVERVRELAADAFEAGEYRWAAELLSHALAVAPDSRAIMRLQASTLEQLGYQAEAAPWRNFYLSAAQDLRTGDCTPPERSVAANREFSRAVSTRMLLDYLAIRFNGMTGAHLAGKILLHIEDRAEFWVLRLGNGVLGYRQVEAAVASDARLLMTASEFSAFARGGVGLECAEAEGDRGLLQDFERHLDSFSGYFSLVRARAAWPTGSVTV